MKLNVEEFVVTPDELLKYWSALPKSLPEDLEKIRPDIIKSLVDRYEPVVLNPLFPMSPEHRVGVFAALLAIEMISRMRPKGATA